MDNAGGSKECSPGDLTGRKAAWLLWYLPIALLVVGLNWDRGRVWLWIPAFVVMGVGCLVNAARCRRIHCYFTGPLFLLAAVFVALSALGESQAASRFLSAHCSGRIMRGDMCGDSAGQVSKASIMLLTMPQEGYGCPEKQGSLRQAQVPLFVVI